MDEAKFLQTKQNPLISAHALSKLFFWVSKKGNHFVVYEQTYYYIIVYAYCIIRIIVLRIRTVGQCLCAYENNLFCGVTGTCKPNEMAGLQFHSS